MNPIEVWASAYGPFESVRWRLPDGLTAVLGRNEEREGVSSNGAGKTKLLETIPIALFGPRLAWSEYVPTGAGEDTVVRVQITRGPAVIAHDSAPEILDAEAGDTLMIRRAEEKATLLMPE